MKAFLSALALFVLLVCIAFFTSFSLTKQAEQLEAQAAKLEDIPTTMRKSATMAMKSAWEEKHFWFSMTINHNEMDEIDDIIARLRMAEKIKDDDDFLIAVSELTAALAHIKDLGAVSWDNIL